MFKVGDVVVLKSGGPDMTVSKVAEKKFSHGASVTVIVCKWFTSSNEVKTDEFLPDLLKSKD